MSTFCRTSATVLFFGLLLPACRNGTAGMPSASGPSKPGSGEVLTVVPVGVVPYAICAADLDGDGRPELVVGGLDQDLLCAVSADGRKRWQYKTAGMPVAVESGDIDGDGIPEIVAVVGTSSSQIIVLDSRGKLQKTIAPSVPVYLLQLADLDGDKKQDIIVAGYMGKILAYNGQGRTLLDKLVCPKNFLRQMAGLAAGDFDGDGTPEIAYHGSLQLPGVIDARGEPIRRWMLPSLGGILLAAADVDEDGRAELILGSLTTVRVERLGRKLWSANLRQTAAQLHAETNAVMKYPWEYGGTRSLVPGNFTNDEGLEIAGFASDGKFNLLSSSGKHLLRAKTRHPFVSIAAADLDGDGLDEALLGRLHHKDVCVVRFAPNPKAAAAAVCRVMSTDAVTDGIDDLLTQIDAIKQKRVRARSRDEKLHVLWGMEATIAPTFFGSTIRALDKKMRQRRCENVEYAFMFTLKERGVAKFKRGGICAVGPLAASAETLLGRCREWEEAGVHFYPVVSHMGVPTVMPETARRIMEVAPNACQGYITWETMVNYPGEVWYDFLRRTEELAKICVKNNKKILMAEEAPFWIALVSDPKARAILLKPEYRGVLVPVLKTLEPPGDETDVAAYVGSMLAREIDSWGITAEEDFWPHTLGHYRGCPDDVVMRQGIMAMSLGARYLMVESGHLYFQPVDAQGRYNPLRAVDARIPREARREHMVVELYRKGILGPVKAEDLLSVSPVGLALSKSPRIDRAAMRWKSFGKRMFDGTGLLNMDLTRAIFNSGPNSLSRNLYGSKKLMNGIFPETPWGIVPIFGPGTTPTDIQAVATTIETDGEFVTHGRRRLHAREAIARIAEAVSNAAAKLPFRADGVFLSARRDGQHRYQVLLMDPEMFAPVDIRTTVVTSIPGLRCVDEIGGQSLPLDDHRVSIVVPAGGWRLLGFEKTASK